MAFPSNKVLLSNNSHSSSNSRNSNISSLRCSKMLCLINSSNPNALRL